MTKLLKKMMTKLLKKIVIVLGLIGLGGCMNHNEVKIKEQQHQLEISIAKLIVSDYEGVETIEFTGWGQSVETGTWGTTVVINEDNLMSLSFSGINSLEQIRGIRYNLDSFRLKEKVETKHKVRIMDRLNKIEDTSLDTINVIYSQR